MCDHIGTYSYTLLRGIHLSYVVVSVKFRLFVHTTLASRRNYVRGSYGTVATTVSRSREVKKKKLSAVCDLSMDAGFL